MMNLISCVAPGWGRDGRESEQKRESRGSTGKKWQSVPS